MKNLKLKKSGPFINDFADTSNARMDVYKQFVKHLALLLPHEANRASSHGQLKSAEIISTSEWNLRNRMKNKAMCRSGFSI